MKSAWIRTLEELRFDVTQRDPLQAHKEYDTRHAVDVALDDSGQIRMRVTRQVGETQSETITSRAGREYRIFVEQNSVVLVNYRRQSGDDLAAILREMEKIAVGLTRT
ncbi:MAG: hypothetical protein HY782_22155 [Chloroflexi bacterium]|nr:hypothetical protein [Chloroflexota bacterium]